MIDRIHYYDEMIVNKDVVRRLESYGREPDIYELVILNYSRYDTVYSKLDLFNKLSREIWTEGVDECPHSYDGKTFNDYINYIVKLYNDGLEALNNSRDYIYLINSVNDPESLNTFIVDTTHAYFHSGSDYDNLIESFDNVTDLYNYIYNYNNYIDMCTVHALSKKDGKIKFKYNYGIMHTGKLNIYQISYPGYWGKNLYQYRIEYPLPYENYKDTYIWYPFMHEKKYIGKPKAEIDGNGTSYGFIEGYGDDFFDAAFTCFDGTNMAVYSALYQ